MRTEIKEVLIDVDAPDGYVSFTAVIRDGKLDEFDTILDKNPSRELFGVYIQFCQEVLKEIT